MMALLNLINLEVYLKSLQSVCTGDDPRSQARDGNGDQACLFKNKRHRSLFKIIAYLAV